MPPEPRALAEVVLDCPDPRALAEFYRAVLGWDYAPGHETDDPDGDEWLVLVPPGGGTKIAFQRSAAPVPPWRAGSIVHLDIRVEDLDDARREVEALGAQRLMESPGSDFLGARRSGRPPVLHRGRHSPVIKELVDDEPPRVP